MSTILDAQRELERRGAPFTPPPRRRDPKPWGVLAAAVAALATVAVVFLWLRAPSRRPDAVTSGIAASGTAASGIAASDTVAKDTVAGPAKPAASRPVDAPAAARGAHAETSTTMAVPGPAVPGPQPAPIAAAEPHAAAPAPAPAPPVQRSTTRREGRSVRVAKSRPAGAPPAPRSHSTSREALPPAAPPPAAAAPVSQDAIVGATAPRIDLKGIDYRQRARERTVTLQIDGGTAVTLHEGQSANGVEVQLILPHTVYLRDGANIFAVGRPLRLQ